MVDPTPIPTVLILDDDPVVRESIADLLHSTGLAVRQCATPEDLAHHLRTVQIGCVILDLFLRESNGLEVQQSIIRSDAGIPIIFLSGNAEIPHSVRAMKAGAVEFLTKPVRDQDLLDAVHHALQHAKIQYRERKELAGLRSRFQQLTPRERQVMQHVISGTLNKQIAFTLGTQEVTVKIQRGKVMQKMQAESLADLVRMAQRLGIPSTNPGPAHTSRHTKA